LLGITPEEADVELGYIVPGAASQDDTFRVERFVEKPSLALAEQLLAQGAVWNSFIFAVTARSLVRLFSREHDAVIERLLYALRVDGWRDGAALARAYERLSAVDFSSHVLAGAASDLRLVPAPACGWTDLGTPARVGRCVEALGARRLRRRDTGARSPLTIDLAAAYTRLQLAV